MNDIKKKMRRVFISRNYNGEQQQNARFASITQRCLTTYPCLAIVNEEQQIYLEIQGAFIMNHIRILCFFIFLFPAGCIQSIQMQTIQRTNSIPDLNYQIYVFSTGATERFRAAFLKSPETDVEVVAASSKIRVVRGTFEDGMNFMQSGAGYRDVDVQSVTYKGKIIGYLLTQSVVPALQTQRVTVNVYQRGGKIYFWAEEILDERMD